MTNKTYLKYLRENKLFDFANKGDNIDQMMLYMFARTQSMFTWSGLPETIPCYMLEMYLQINGYAGICKVNGDLYAFYGGLGGEPDAYYQPTILTVANPYLQLNKEFKIGKDCVVIRNDVFYQGLTPLFNKYASQLAENELSMYMATINTRIQSAISAGDDTTKESAQKFIDDLIKGKLSVIADNPFLESLKTLPLSTSANTNVLGDLIEQEQYLKASWYNELGLNANYNMKREALNSAESTINNDILFPLVDEMLKQRQIACEQINALFGTDISVELSSSWEDNKKEEQAEIKSSDEQESESEAEESESEAEESEPEAEESEPEAEESTSEAIEEIKEDIEEIKDDLKEGDADDREKNTTGDSD